MELFIGQLDLSPYLYGENRLVAAAKLAGVPLEVERDLYTVLKFYRYRSVYSVDWFIPLYCTGQKKRFIFGSKYFSDGRLKLNLGKIGDFFLLNQDNEWWQAERQSRKPLNRTKAMFATEEL